MYRTILVCVDGSDGSNRAAVHALTLAVTHDATLHAIHVVDTHRYGEPALSSVEFVINELESEGTALLEDFAERADNEGVTVTTQCRHGYPPDTITTYADEIDADVVVMGFQGQSHQRLGHVGSVTERVVRSSDRPVLVA